MRKVKDPNKPCKHGHACGRGKDGRCIDCKKGYGRVNRERHMKDYVRRTKKWMGKQEDYNKDYHLLHTYSITLKERNLMIEKQGNVCPVCDKPFGSDGNLAISPAVDHDHKCCPGSTCCGKCIRGIVHKKCNFLIGLADDNPVILKQAAGYLEKYR